MPFRIHVIGNRRPPALNRFRQHFAHGKINSLHAIGAQRRRQSLRMNARAKQRLIGIDIADAAHHSLIQQHGFHRRFTQLQTARKFFERNLQRFRPQRSHARGKFFSIFDSAKLPRVFINQRAAIQRENRVRPLRQRAIDQQPTRHPQMNHKESAIEANRDELSMALNGHNLPPRERIGGLTCGANNYADAGEFGIEDAPSHNRRTQRSNDGFHFRKLRHFRAGPPERRCLAPSRDKSECPGYRRPGIRR